VQLELARTLRDELILDDIKLQLVCDGVRRAMLTSVTRKYSTNATSGHWTVTRKRTCVAERTVAEIAP